MSHTLERTAGYYLPMMAGATVAYARSIPQLAEDLQQAILPGRIQVAVLQPAAAALLYLGLGRARIGDRARRALYSIVGMVALILFSLSATGLTQDYDRPLIDRFDLGVLGHLVFSQYRFSWLGYAAAAHALLSATAGGVLLGISARRDPVAQGFFFLGYY